MATVAGVTNNGEIITGVTETNQTPKSTGSALGKDAFLQLLVTQMKYQDPTNPMDNTEMISQLAQFSALEEMQNVSAAVTNAQALSLVGKNVIMEVGKSSGADNTVTVGGYVQYIQMKDGKAQLCINGSLYDYDDLEMVVDDEYLKQLQQEANGGAAGKEDKETDSN